MANPFLSGRIPAELQKQVDEFLARTGESKTEMLAKAVAAYIGAEVPPLKVAGDRRLENLEREVAELKGAVKSLYEKLAMFTPKAENPKVELELSNSCDNSIDNTDNMEDVDKVDYTFSDIENTINNSDNTPEVSPLTDVTPTSDGEKTFINIETAEVARLTKLPTKKFTSLRHSFNEKLKKQNQSLPEKKRLDSPIKITPASGVKIEKVPYDIFYVGHSKEGRNLWNLVPITTVGQDVPLPFTDDNNR